MSDVRSYRFADFRFDTRTLQLRHRDEPVPLAVRPARVLAILLERAGRVVSREELIAEAWDGRFVSDDALFSAVRDLRHALGDDARHPRFVETVHRRGYRFAVPVEAVPGAGDPGAAETVHGDGPRHPWRRTVLGLLAVAGGLALVLLLVVARESRTGGGGSRLHELLRWRRGLFKPAYSPRGELLAAVAPDPVTGVDSLFLLKPGLEESLALTRNLEVRGPAPVFSPDGGHVYFTVYGARGGGPSIWKVSVLGGEARPFLRGATAISFDPGGVRFAWTAVTESGSEVRIRGMTGRDRLLAAPGHWPRWSPDGRWIAWTTSDPEGGDGHLFVAHPDGSGRRRLTLRRTQHYGLCWTPDSSAVVLATDRSGTFDLWLYRLDGTAPRALTVGAGNATSPTVRPDGRRIVFCRGEKLDGLAVLDTPDGPARWAVASDRVVRAALGPDGRVAAILERADGRELVVIPPDSATPRLVGKGPLEFVSFLPGGALLVALREGRGSRIERWGPGAADRELVRRDPEALLWPAPAPGGALVAVRRRGRLQALVLVDRDDREQTLATAARIERPVVSPDGSAVAYSGGYRPPSTEAGGVWVVALAGGVPRRVWPDGAWPCWSADGRELVFTRYFEADGIWTVPLTGGEPRRIAGPPGGRPLWFLDADPSTGRLLCHVEVQSPSLWALDDPAL